MAYIFDPIRNTFIDDEDKSLGNKLALNDEEIDKVIKQIDDKFGPKTVVPASELPPKEDPYKDFMDRNPAADGGMIGGGVIQGEDYGDRSGFATPKFIQGGSRTPVQFRGKYGVRSMLQIPADTPGYLGKTGEQLVFETEADAQRFIDQDLDDLNLKAKQNKKRSPVIEQRLQDIRNYVKELKKSGNKKIFLDDVVQQFLGSETVTGTGRYQDEQTELSSRTTVKDNIKEALGQKEYDKLIKGPGGDRKVLESKKQKFNKLVLDINRGDLPITDLGREERGDASNIKRFLTDANKKRFDKLYSKLKMITSRISQPSETLTEEGIEELKKTTTKNFDATIKKYPSSLERRTNVFKGGTRFYDAKSYILSLLGRHVEQGGKLYRHVGGDTMKDVKFRNLKTNKLITIRNMDLNSPEFKEAATVYDEFEKLKNSSIDNPITGEKITLNNAIKEGSDGKDYLIIDHQKGVKKSPLKNLNVTTQKQNIGFELAGLSEDEKKRFYREKVDFDTNLDRFTKYGQRLLTKGGYKKPKETIQDYRQRASNFAQDIKSKMDASRMLTSKIPGGAVALTPLDFTLSMMSGMPLTESLASAGSYLIKDPYIGRAINVPLAMAQEMQDEGDITERIVDRRQKLNALLERVSGLDAETPFMEQLINRVKEGAGDQPEIDAFQAKDGGRVGFENGGAVGADDDFAKELEYYFLNEDAELPKATSYRETMNPVEALNDMIDPRNYPYYADLLVRSGLRVGEFGVRILPALGKLGSDLLTKPAFRVTGTKKTGYVQDYEDIPGTDVGLAEGLKLEGTGIFQDFLKNITPTSMEKKVGLEKLIEAEEQKQKDRRSTIAPKVLGETISLGAEVTAPVFPGLRLLRAFAAERKLPVDNVTKDIMEKEIDEALDARGISRRDFMKVAGAGGSVMLAKMLGVSLETAPKVAEKVASTGSGAPPYFFRLVDKIRALGRSGPGTKDRSESFVYGDYEMEIDYDTGAIDIKRTEQGMFGDEIAPTEEVNMFYRPGVADETTKGKVPPDDYEEYTVRPDGDGKMKDVEDGVPDDVIDEGSISKEELEQLIIRNLANE